ncbi:hypothetical protein Misp06_00260 [Microbulbifer sp. NBRC 101763]
MGIGNAFQGATWATKGVAGKGIMGTGLNGYGYAEKVFAHSVTGGLLSAAQGGKFKHGFAAAGVTQAFAGGIDSIDAGNVGFSATRVIAAAIVGGTASAVSGGKFANGAITAAFSRAFNDEGHPPEQKREANNDFDWEGYDLGPAPTEEILSLMAIETLFGFEVDVVNISIFEFDWRTEVTNTYATTRVDSIYLRKSKEHFFDRPFTVLEEYYHVIEQWNTGRMTRTGYLIENARNGYDNNKWEIEAKGFAKNNLKRFKQIKDSYRD